MNNELIKIAIAIFKTRVSPRFDCAPKMLIIEKSNSEVGKRREIDTEGWAALKRIKQLHKWSINILICGGIDEHSVRLISADNIKIYSWITGEYEDAISSFMNGKLASGNMMGPGGISQGKWRFRRWRQDFNRGGVRCRIETEKGRGGRRG